MPDNDNLGEEERRRRRKERREAHRDDIVEEVADAALDSGVGLPGGRSSGGRGGSDTPRGGGGSSGSGGSGSGSGSGGGRCDSCDGPCDFSLLRVSAVLLLAAAVMPAAHGGRLVLSLIRGYQRWLSRFTPRCPSTPSCSRYAHSAVESLGPRRGLAAAARRIRHCGNAPDLHA